MPGLLTLHKLGTRIDWNPAGKPGPVDVERVGLFRVRVGAGGVGRGNNVGNDGDGMPRYAGYRAELRSFEVWEERESYEDTAWRKYSEPDMYAPRRRVGKRGERENTSLSVLSLRGEKARVGGREEGQREAEIGR